ncbi:hypothetical protein GCM10010431_14170 [Streptomyces kunmingensis]
MPGGLFLVFSARSPTTSGSTVTAPAGAVAGPAAGSAHTRARATDRASDVDGAAVGSAGPADVLSQPTTASRAAAATGIARFRHLIPTRPP